MINITELLIAISGLIITIISIKVFPYIKLTIKSEEWAMLNKIVFVAVNAAEQLGVTNVIKDKFAYALDEIEKQLENANIIFDLETIKLAIEASVRQNFPKK